MTDADEQNKKLADAKKKGLLDPKVLKIDEAQAKNKKSDIVENLNKFIGSIVQSFSGNNKITNPSPSILRITAGKEVIAHQNLNFDIDGYKKDDITQEIQGEAYIKSTLYPDDIILIIASIRDWLALRCKQEGGERSWIHRISSLNEKLNEAKERHEAKRRGEEAISTTPIADFSKSQLQDATQELLEAIQYVWEKLEKTEIEYDSIDESINEIKARFAKEPAEAWRDIGLVLTRALSETDINTPAVTALDKTLRVSDVRTVINAIYKEIFTQIEKTDAFDPWNRASEESKQRFSSQKQPYFSINEVEEQIVTNNDISKTEEFIKWIDQLLEELSKKPKPEEEEVAEDETDEEGGGEEDVTEEKIKLEPEVVEQITSRVIKFLINQSGEEFFKQALGLEINPDNLSPAQKDWFLVRLPNYVQEILAANDNQAKIEQKIKKWIASNLKPNTDNQSEKQNFEIKQEQLLELQQFIAQQFFLENKEFFKNKISQIPLTEELEKAEPEKVEKRPAEAVVTPAEAAPAGAAEARGETLDRNKFISDTTTAFLGLNFGQDCPEELRKFIYYYVAQNTPENITSADIVSLRLKMYGELQRNDHFYQLSHLQYQLKLQQLGLKDDKTLINLYNGIDSLLVLVENPQKFLADLNDQELIEYFGLEGQQVDPQALKGVLMGLVFIRRSHYYVKNSVPQIKPWLNDEQSQDKEKVAQYSGAVRGLINKVGQQVGGEAGEDVLMAFNLNGEEISKSTIDEHRKETIKNLYRELWLKTVAGKTQDELIEVYQFYGVDVIQIDYTKLPTPENFSYSSLAQDANAGRVGKNGIPAANLFKKGKRKLGKTALGAIAPELLPILDLAEKLPIIGTKVKEIEEKTANWLMAGATGIIALIGILAKSAGLIIGALTGLVSGIAIGFSIGGPLGAAIGGVLGAIGGGTTGYHFNNIKNWFKGSGGSATKGAAETSTGAATQTAATAATPTVAVVGTLGGTALLTWMTLTGINSALQHPIQKFSYYTIDPNTGMASPYVQIVKEAQPSQASSPQTITYSIQIATYGDYSITINEIADETDIRYNEDKYPGGIPDPNPATRTIADFPDLEPGTTIESGEKIVFEYTVDYTDDYQHANVVNYFTLHFDYDDGSDSGTAEAMTLASVKFGEAPVFDGCWPVPGTITQLPFGGYSHRSETKGYGADAVDIGVPVGTKVYASFGGKVIQAGNRGNYGTVVVIVGDAGSFIYGHLSQTLVSVGNTVSAGDIIALSGNTGASSGPHLHYERGNSSGYFYATPVNSSSILLQLHNAAGIRVGDTVSNAECVGN